LYKGTKIVHNLYPVTDQFTPKRVLNYRRGSPKSIYYVKSCKAKIEIPYFDQNKIIRYKIIFQRDDYKKKEQIFINRFHADGTPFQIFYVGQRNLINSSIDQTVLWAYEFCEYPNLERIILSIDSSIKNGTL
jgi:hypothetical protein